MQSLSDKSKKAIASVHCIAKILFNHFIENECDIIDDKQLNAQSILSNIYIMGGAPRDILLNKDVNDIDILVNTQKLNILHLNHLNKYHSSYKQQSQNSSCIFWKLYLKKLNDKNHKNSLYNNQITKILPNNSRVKIGYFQNINYDDDNKENVNPLNRIKVNTRNILDSNYMLNSKYFTDIISQSVELKNYIDVVIYAKNLFRLNEIKINKDIFYNDINLKGESIDFLDAVKRNANMNIIRQYEMTEFNKLFPNKYLYSECRQHHFEEEKCDEKDGSIKIEMEIYDVSAMEAILKADLSLNTLWIDFLSVLGEDTKDGNKIDFNWYDKITCCKLLTDYDAKQDFKNKMITHPYLHQTVLIQRPKYHFFRIIKMYITLGHEWTIDINLIHVTKKYFYLWLKDEDFWDNDNEDGYPFILWNLFDRDRYSPTNAKQLYLMLYAFQLFHVNKIFINKLKEIKGFMLRFIQSLKHINTEMIQLYETYGYPVSLHAK